MGLIGPKFISTNTGILIGGAIIFSALAHGFGLATMSNVQSAQLHASAIPTSLIKVEKSYVKNVR